MRNSCPYTISLQTASSVALKPCTRGIPRRAVCTGRVLSSLQPVLPTRSFSRHQLLSRSFFRNSQKLIRSFFEILNDPRPDIFRTDTGRTYSHAGDCADYSWVSIIRTANDATLFLKFSYTEPAFFRKILFSYASQLY